MTGSEGVASDLKAGLYVDRYLSYVHRRKSRQKKLKGGRKKNKKNHIKFKRFVSLVDIFKFYKEESFVKSRD